MHSWFSKRLNEMIDLSQYCRYPVLQAHFVLTQKAVDELYGQSLNAGRDSLRTILPLLISQAKLMGEEETQAHLEKALATLEAARQEGQNVVSLPFSNDEPQDKETCA